MIRGRASVQNGRPEPQTDVDPAHWGTGPECTIAAVQVHHLHDAFLGHGDPDREGCGHGVLLWGFLEPI